MHVPKCVKAIDLLCNLKEFHKLICKSSEMKALECLTHQDALSRVW